MPQLILMDSNQFREAALIDPEDIQGRVESWKGMFRLGREAVPSQLELTASLATGNKISGPGRSTMLDKHQLYGYFSPLIQEADEFAKARGADYFEFVVFRENLTVQTYSSKTK